MTKSERYALQQDAYRLLGFNEGEFCGDVMVAVNCAIDMGYRTPGGVATMARKLYDGPHSDSSLTSNSETKP